MIHARYLFPNALTTTSTSNAAKAEALGALCEDPRITCDFSQNKETNHALAEQSSPQETLLNTFVPGALIEVVGNASTTAMAALLAQVQRGGEPVAWITGDNSSLYPPDLHRAGVDLESLACVRIRTRHFGPPVERLRAAEMLIRSGAFGLVMLEVPGSAPMPARALSRLHALARRHQTRVIFRVAYAIGTVGTESLGPLVGTQLRVTRDIQGGKGVIRAEVLKQKGTRTLPDEVVLSETLLWPIGAAPQGAETLVAPSDFSPDFGHDLQSDFEMRDRTWESEQTGADQTGKFEALKAHSDTVVIDSVTSVIHTKTSAGPKRAGLKKSKRSKNAKKSREKEKNGQISLFSEAI